MHRPRTRFVPAVASLPPAEPSVAKGRTTPMTVADPTIQVKNERGRGAVTASR
jgi:hypothetical protein